MRVSEDTIQTASRLSWDYMFKGEPLRDWELTQSKDPEIIEAHTKRVRSLFEADFDIPKSVRIASNGTHSIDEMSDFGKDFIKRMSEFIQGWAKNSGVL